MRFSQAQRVHADREFVTEIVSIPDYYLTTARGFEGLQGVQRLYSVDVMALVSYDQVSHMNDNKWSLAKFEADVRAGKANVRVARRESSAARGGSGSFGPLWLAGALILVAGGSRFRGND